jgi:tetratricopeptide (TPR) repeat protein
VLAGRCLPYGEGITYWPLREIFAGAGAENELDTALGAGAPEEIFYAVRKAIEARARERPMMLIVEDIHWAEPTLLELLEHLADWTRDAQLLLFCLSRPELLDARPAWGGRANAENLTLEPLPEREADELIDELLAGATLGGEARDRVRSVAEGNPLFVEQLLAMVAEGGDTERVPPTIHALLSARLDALPAEERTLLERASVIGHGFEWESLTALDPDLRRPSGASLSALVRKDLIRPHETVGDSFWFRHILIRDAAYARVPKEVRSQYHERFAGWLENRGDEFQEIIAYHLEQAARLVSELGPPTPRGAAIAERAAVLLIASGRRANSRGDLSAAANLLERATTLLPTDDPRRRELLPQLARQLFFVGRTERARTVLEDAVEVASTANDRSLEAEATVELLFLRLQVGEITQGAMRQEAEMAVRVLEEAGDLKRLGRALSILGTLGYWRGEAEAVGYLERSAQLAKAAGDRGDEHHALSYLLAYHMWGPTPVAEAREFLLRRVVAPAAENRFIESGLLLASAHLDAMEGRFEEARAAVSRAKAIAEELGNRRTLATVYSRLGGVELFANDLIAAERNLRASCDIFGELGQWGYYVTPGWLLASVLCDLDRDEEAARVLDVVDRYTVPEDLEPEIGRRAARAKLLARRGELAEAEAKALEAVAKAAATEFTENHAQSLVILSEVLRRAGRNPEAKEALEQALQIYRAKGNVAQIARLQGQSDPV